METQLEKLTHYDLVTLLCAIVLGTLVRLLTLRVDHRQVPSVPNGYFIHLVNGFLAACLGAVAIPSFLSRDFAAVTFLMLAVQHFREIRKQEKESLESLEKTGFALRGDAYIDGIAKTYEARSYISLLTSFGIVLAVNLISPSGTLSVIAVSICAGALLGYLMVYLTKGKKIGDICDVREASFEMRGASLYVEDIYVTNLIGTEQGRDLFMREGLAFIAAPRSQKHRLTIENDGQKQAMLFEAIRSFGVKRYNFTRRSFPDGRIVIAFVPINPDKAGIAEAIRKTPVLESIRKRSTLRRG